MKKLGAYIGRSWAEVEQNTFIWYEVLRQLTPRIDENVYDVEIWSLKGGYPNGRKPDIKFTTTNPQLIDNTVIPLKDVPHKYYIEWEDQTCRIDNCTVYCDYPNEHECISSLSFSQGFPDNSIHWRADGERAMSVLKNATVSTVDNMIKNELKKSIEQEVMKDVLYGTGGFTTTNDFISNRVLSVNEALKIWENKNKETKTMEKKTMTETDAFLKHINGIMITSKYSKLDFGDFGAPYYIYYPEMEITEDIADTLLTVLIMAKRDYIKKVVFNPEKGTTAIAKTSDGYTTTVRCKDGKFDYILGYEMARSKMYFGSNDYNWFNKIKNHRKTHIEYTEKPTEPKAKKTSKKGGKKS